MYDLPSNATMSDVIVRSFVCHPTLFSNAMSAAASQHRHYSNLTTDKHVARIALGMAEDLSRMALDTYVSQTDDSFDVNSLTLSERIQAFSVAAKLQCLPHSLQQEIAARG